MRNLALLALILAVLMTPAYAEPTPVAVGFEPSYSGDGGRISYAAIKGGVRDIYTVDEAGGIRQLTSDIYWDGQPVFTPESKGVVFISDRSGSRELWQIDLESRDMNQLTSSALWKTDPAVGPKGEVAFIVGRHPTLDIYITGDGVERRLTFLEDELYSPTWSPDGNRLAFVRGDELMMINRDGSGLEKIASGVYHRGISWAVDGRILYLTRNIGYDLWSISVENGEKELIYEGVTDSWEVNPAISRQGDIAFSTDKDGFYRIYELEIKIPLAVLEPTVSEPAPATITVPIPVPHIETVQAPIPAPLPVLEAVENTVPETIAAEISTAGENDIVVSENSGLKDEIRLPGSMDASEVEPVGPARDEIEIPTSPQRDDSEITVGDDNVWFWLVAATALIGFLIERLKYKRPEYALQ